MYHRYGLAMQICVEIYGCATNRGDAAIVEGLLVQHGHSLVKSVNEADVVVLMTCIVIDTTHQRMLHRLRTLHKFGKKVVVGGCLPAVLPDQVNMVAPGSPMMTPRCIHQIVDIVNGHNPVLHQADKGKLPRTVGLRTYLTIADGCQQACSYCITRSARGTLKSYAEKGLVAAARHAIKHGCREICLTAQDAAAYGLDTGTSIASLATKISEIDGDFRIRVGMMHPGTVQHRFEDILSTLCTPKVYRFLHLPLQSGSDTVLEAMHRDYTTNEFITIVKAVRNAIPDINLTTDVIVGFPRETDSQFNKTCRIIEALRPDMVNVTRFSARPKTPAKTMQGRLSTQEVKERSRVMAAVAKKTMLIQHQDCIGTTTQALILKKRDDGMILGKTDGYRSIHLPSGRIGDIMSIKVTDAKVTHLIGDIL